MKGSVVRRRLIGQRVDRDVKLEDRSARVQKSGLENPDKSSGLSGSGSVQDGVGGTDEADVFTDLELGDPGHLLWAPDLDDSASETRIVIVFSIVIRPTYDSNAKFHHELC